MLPKRFPFRFSVPCFHRQKLWGDGPARLGVKHRLVDLAELEGRKGFADVHAAWNAEGLAFSIQVTGKRQPAWCRTSRPEESDGVQLWVDTRDVHNVHRASRFCHRFLFLPNSGPKTEQPVAQWMPIHRAREHPQAISKSGIRVRSKVIADGYVLDVLLTAAALTGFDPSEHPRLGFNYAVLDRELGEQTFTVGSPMPYAEDPSLWASLELTR